MNSETLSALASVIGVLNTIETKGKQNLNNLAGAIAILEDIWNKLSREAGADQKAPPQTEGR